jgi:CRP-like cAMP-binding protein
VYDRTHQVFKATEPATHLYFVKRGSLELSMDETLVMVLGKGEMFGHPALVQDLDHTTTARTTVYVEV